MSAMSLSSRANGTFKAFPRARRAEKLTSLHERPFCSSFKNVAQNVFLNQNEGFTPPSILLQSACAPDRAKPYRTTSASPPKRDHVGALAVQRPYHHYKRTTRTTRPKAQIQQIQQDITPYKALKHHLPLSQVRIPPNGVDPLEPEQLEHFFFCFRVELFRVVPPCSSRSESCQRAQRAKGKEGKEERETGRTFPNYQTSSHTYPSPIAADRAGT